MWVLIVLSVIAVAAAIAAARFAVRGAQASADLQRLAEINGNLQRENEHARGELESRPRPIQRLYRVVTIGMSGTGKTALTLPMANPVFDHGRLKATQIERYRRTISHVRSGDLTTEHVLEFVDYGGEHIVDALHEAITEEIHGLLIVTDLSGPSRPGLHAGEAESVDLERIARQLRQFQPEVLSFFFGTRTLASCKTIVLFINKSDVVAGTPAEVEEIARGHYQKLIDDLAVFEAQVDIQVFVGSALAGHGTGRLFAHLVRQILPRTAYDEQLRQHMAAATAGSVSANLAQVQRLIAEATPEESADVLAK